MIGKGDKRLLGQLISTLKKAVCLGACFLLYPSSGIAMGDVQNKKGSQTMDATKTNRLIHEKSPYLLQHAENPVNWYPWGEEAFGRAQNESKPIFLSIGYSTCHWCHVMAHESFENSEIARILNEHFIAIKVDREERPDIDNIYMTAVMSMEGQGGWPLSVFLTPDKKPFYGGTYFPPYAQWGRPGFKELLLSISGAWKNQREEILQSSRSITLALQKNSAGSAGETVAVSDQILEKAYQRFAHSFDPVYGGFGSAPKFPTSHNLSFLLRYWKRTGEPHALAMVEKTLEAMAQGGMYDHLGGGFHRYSTDQDWLVPHFEKMLYDQALLARTYLEAYQATKKSAYAQTAREIFDYVLRDMQAPQGGFYSAEDADSLPPEEPSPIGVVPGPAQQKSEGAFYLWRYDEIMSLLGPEDGKIFTQYFGVKPMGNVASDPHGEFKGKNILHATATLNETADSFHVEERLKRSQEKLLALRSKRPRPHRDDKILVDWNGLVISSLAFGSRVLDEPRYREAAEKAAGFILKNLVREDGRLFHRYRDKEAAILGAIDDYAFFIHGLIDLYEATLRAEYLKEARHLTEEMIRLFWDTQRGGFYFTAFDAEELLWRQKEIYDGAIPSGNSLAALDLIRLGRLMERDWEKKAQDLFKIFFKDISLNPQAYAQTLMAIDFAIGPSKEIVIAASPNAPQTREMIQRIYGRFLPSKVVIFRSDSKKESLLIISLVPFIEKQIPLGGKPTAYVCENYVCQFPTTDLRKFEELLK